MFFPFRFIETVWKKLTKNTQPLSRNFSWQQKLKNQALYQVKCEACCKAYLLSLEESIASSVTSPELNHPAPQRAEQLQRLKNCILICIFFPQLKLTSALLLLLQEVVPVSTCWGLRWSNRQVKKKIKKKKIL